ncbi:MAG: unnamed protein product [uncultured Caballeronia sp.]|nr:MAG: unnamed protein product [uncultured Caballeronia sp.]
MYQDLAMIPLMSVARNFFMGREPKKGFGPVKFFDAQHALKVTREEMLKSVSTYAIRNRLSARFPAANGSA